MPDVKWIRITTDMFDDDKIKLIESMPDRDTLLIIWIKLICQAGKINANGNIFLSEGAPYTEEELATIFNRPVNTIRLALNIFEKYKMIQVTNESIFLPNFEKHQNMEGLDKIRLSTKRRVAAFRERESLKLLSNKTTNEPVTLRNVTVTGIDKIRIDKIREEQEENKKETSKENTVVAVIPEKKNKVNTITGADPVQEEPGSDNSDAAAADSKHNLNLSSIVICYEQNIGTINPIIAEELQDISRNYSGEWFSEAVKEACKQNVRRLKYVVGILERWKTDGFKAGKDDKSFILKNSKFKTQKFSNMVTH